jgi:hypothetical protein
MYVVNRERSISMLTPFVIETSHCVVSGLRPVQNSCMKEKKSENLESCITVLRLQRFVCIKHNSLIK